MTDTPETLKAALANLTARVAAFEKARVEEEEPEKVAPANIDCLLNGTAVPYTQAIAGRRLRYCERELARLREGLKGEGEGEGDENVAYWANDPRHRTDREYGVIRAHSFAREIQRHRALVGGGK